MVTNNAANQSSPGLQSLTSVGVFNGRTITGTANQISVTNGDGIAGNPTIALTSNVFVSGISFNSGTNTLSSFTEGTWTPSISSDGTPPSAVTYVSNGQIGRYTQIGNAIVITCRLALSTYVAGTGNATIITLPFTPAAVTNQNFVTTCNPQNLTYGASVNWMVCRITQNSTAANLIGNISAAPSYTTLSTDIAINSIISFTGWYSIV